MVSGYGARLGYGAFHLRYSVRDGARELRCSGLIVLLYPSQFYGVAWVKVVVFVVHCTMVRSRAIVWLSLSSYERRLRRGGGGR